MMTDEEFKKKLNPEQYRVMRQKDTERPYSGKYWDSDENGVYACAACSTVLFASLAKFDSETGWPSFSSGLDEKYFEFSKTADRTEILCKKCGSHLGYLVPRSNNDSGKPYYQVNSAALTFQPVEVEIEQEEGGKKESADAATKKEPNIKVSAPSSLLPQAALVAVAAIVGALLGGGLGYSSCKAPVGTPGVTGTTSQTTVQVNTSATFSAPKPGKPAQQTTTTVGAPVVSTSSAPAPGTPVKEPAMATSSSASDGTI